MTLVMDGVRRISAPVLPPVMVTPKPTPLPVGRPVAMTGSIGLDGIRRPSMPTPRQVIENMQAVVAEAAPPVVLPTAAETELAHSRNWHRPAIAFSLVAGALVVSGAMMAAVNQSHAQAAATDLKTTAAKAVPPAAPVKPAPAVVAQQTQAAALQQILNTFVAAHGNKFGIVVADLKTGATATINSDTSMESASLYKLFVADRVYNAIDTGKLSYSSAAGGGSGRNVQSCLTVMINISDNTCGHALGQLIGWGSQNAALSGLGFTGTNLTGPYQQTSPHDVALLFQRLYEGTLNSPNSNTDFMNLLKDQRVNNRLPLGLPAGTMIAHKTGDLDGYMHDAGIVYGPKTDYVVTVMGKPGANPSDFSALSQQLWSYFQL